VSAFDIQRRSLMLINSTQKSSTTVNGVLLATTCCVIDLYQPSHITLHHVSCCTTTTTHAATRDDAQRSTQHVSCNSVALIWCRECALAVRQQRCHLTGESVAIFLLGKIGLATGVVYIVLLFDRYGSYIC